MAAQRFTPLGRQIDEATLRAGEAQLDPMAIEKHSLKAFAPYYSLHDQIGLLTNGIVTNVDFIKLVITFLGQFYNQFLFSLVF